MLFVEDLFEEELFKGELFQEEVFGGDLSFIEARVCVCLCVYEDNSLKKSL